MRIETVIIMYEYWYKQNTNVATYIEERTWVQAIILPPHQECAWCCLRCVMLCSLWDRWVVTTPIYSTEIFCMRWEVHMEGTRGNVFIRCHTFYSMETNSGKLAKEG